MPTHPRRPLTLARLLPNMLTLGGLCCGLTGMRFAILERWELAATFIVIAAFIDGFDGRLARLLKASSNFGAQLDSLSDMVCFGVAPAFILYLWKLQDMRAFGWTIALLYVVCAALRLARFNASLDAADEPREPWRKKFFTGVPAPSGAMLALLPLTATLALGDEAYGLQWLFTPAATGAVLLISALLMASRVPTVSLKGVRVGPQWALPVMLAASFWVVSLVIHPWETMAFSSLAYLAIMPFGIAWFMVLARKNSS